MYALPKFPWQPAATKCCFNFFFFFFFLFDNFIIFNGLARAYIYDLSCNKPPTFIIYCLGLMQSKCNYYT